MYGKHLYTTVSYYTRYIALFFNGDHQTTNLVITERDSFVCTTTTTESNSVTVTGEAATSGVYNDSTISTSGIISSTTATTTSSGSTVPVVTASVTVSLNVAPEVLEVETFVIGNIQIIPYIYFRRYCYSS